MKKLMFLGGGRYLIPAIEAAHKLGIYVITADYLPENYAHKYSDEYVNVSIIDPQAVLRAAESKKIDGIISYACDPGVVPAAFVAEKMDLPQTGPYDSVCILQNKKRFRNFLKDNGFNVPFIGNYKNIEEALKDESIPFPCIVKPADSSGSKGVTKVSKRDELNEAICRALEESLNKEFIVEGYIESYGCPSDADALSVDGELVVFSMSDQLFDEKAENKYVPAAYSFPSTMEGWAQKELKSEVQRLIKLLSMKTCIYNIEVRLGTDGKAYIMECTPRAGGNRLAELLRYGAGVDIITETVKGAVGMRVEKEHRDVVFAGNWFEIILHAPQKGYFEGIDIKSPYDSMVVDRSLWVKKGDFIEEFTGANKTIGNVIMNCKTQEEKKEIMNNIDKYIYITVNSSL